MHGRCEASGPRASRRHPRCDRRNREYSTATDRSERLRRDAILYNLVIVGEAVKRLDAATTGTRPEIPWRNIAGLRDLLTHAYFRIEWGEIEKILKRDLGPLDVAVHDLLR